MKMKNRKTLSRILLGSAALVLLLVFVICLINNSNKITACIWAGGAVLLGVLAVAIDPDEDKAQRTVNGSLAVLVLSLMVLAFVMGKGAAPVGEREASLPEETTVETPKITETAEPSFTPVPTPEPTSAPNAEPVIDSIILSFTDSQGESDAAAPRLIPRTPEPEPVRYPDGTVPEEEGVYYITRTGSCFHRRGCQYSPYKWYATREEAIAAGYSACSKCKP